ncbi:ATP-binding cassette domain-containing protein [uncultured Shimia sp.]|uniref:ATP-binding cassette domain-containing protein n=1 Tax=uncultured Shimia sp. TaxID=573152 RepID=UPI0026188F8B|nr:ATP-binding cassette domain-containing protein [uncultured Shimia sp.]
MSALFPLIVEAAVTRRHGKVLVGPVDLTLDAGGATIVIGPNGAGKTSLLRMLHGIARLHSGRIEWACDQDTARARQAFVFQTPVMLRRTVQDNLAYPLRLIGMRRTESRAKAAEMAARIGLEEALGRPATVLSGGERQKLALGRALIRSPDLLFLDEPCASLDGRAMREVEDILTTAVRDGTRLIMSTHNMGQAKRLASDVVFLLGGKIHEQGDAKSFFETPSTAQARAFLKGDIVE